MGTNGIRCMNSKMDPMGRAIADYWKTGSLVLQEKSIDVTAIDISPLSVETMKDRGVKKVTEQDFFTLEGQYDTILMLMNGIGIVGTLERMSEFFKQLDKILAPGGADELADGIELSIAQTCQHSLLVVDVGNHFITLQGLPTEL